MALAIPRACVRCGRTQCDCKQKAERERSRRRRAQANGVPAPYYDRRWRKIRALWLAQYPLCVMCQAEGKTTPATIVDHIEPHKGDWSKFHDPENFQSLCASHHGAKSAKE